MNRNLIIISICVLITFGATIFFVRNLRHKQLPVKREIIKDSIRISQQRADMHRDSAIYYHNEAKHYEISLDSIRRLDSLSWAVLRERYLSALTTRIGQESKPCPTGQCDSVRIPETDRAEFATGKRSAP